MADRLGASFAPSDSMRGEILSPASSPPNATTAKALVGRLVRGGDVPPELLGLVDGPLADAVSKAADCPVAALEAWLRRAKIRRGPVFRRITAAGTIENRLTGDGVYKILRVRAAAAELTVSETERLSPHGLRAGMITEATLNGALDEQIMPHSRHKHPSSMRRYRGRGGGTVSRGGLGYRRHSVAS